MSMINPYPSFVIYIEGSLLVKALETRENRIRDLLNSSCFDFRDLSSGYWEWNGRLLQKENNECIGIYDVNLIVFGTKRFPNWLSIRRYLFSLRGEWYSNYQYTKEPAFFICSKEWLLLQKNHLIQNFKYYDINIIDFQTYPLY